MVGFKWATGLMVLAGLVGFSAAKAEDEPSTVAISSGTWETLRSHDTKPEVDIDYRFGTPLLFFIRPQIGALAAGDGDFYLYGGFVSDFHISGPIVLTLNSSIGGYGGHGFNLGSHFEFRNGGEIAYQFENKWRLGAAFYHISNAGLTRENGGSESALAVLTIPTPW